MNGRLLLIGLENVQMVDLTELPADVDVMIFHGALQKTIPLSLVTQTQSIGSRLKWIRIAGQGPNASWFPGWITPPESP